MNSYNYLLTGGAGYVGSELASALSRNGHNIKIIDKLYFETNLSDLSNVEVIKKDVRELKEEDFKDIDIVVDLAAISNDPSAELNQEISYKINAETRLNTCKSAKSAGVKGYILASSCSVYGFNSEIVNEKSSVHPLTTYAFANILAENLVTSYSDKNFSVLVFRQATLFGLSKRMRFDLVINGMTYSGIKNKKINILRDGNQKRPLLSLNELNNRYLSIDEDVFKKNNGEIFNIGNNSLNLTINDIFEMVSSSLGGKFEKNWYGDPDHRSYEVDFTKAETVLPKIEESNNIEEIKKIASFIKSDNFNYKKCITLDWYKHLLDKNPNLFDI